MDGDKWTALVGAAITTIFGGGLWAYLSTRQKQSIDAAANERTDGRVAMATVIEKQGKRIDDLEAKHDECLASHIECMKAHAESQHKIGRLEEAVRRIDVTVEKVTNGNGQH